MNESPPPLAGDLIRPILEEEEDKSKVPARGGDFRLILQSILTKESINLSHLTKPRTQPLIMSNAYVDAMEEMTLALIDRYIRRSYRYAQYRMQRLQEMSKKPLPITIREGDFAQAWLSMVQDSCE